MSRLYTFLFTDIVGSTPKWEKHPQEMAESLALHNTVCLRVFQEFGGDVFKSLGDGFGVAFERPEDGVKAAVATQKALADQTWTVPGGMEVRIGVCCGSAESTLGDYFGPAVNRVARLCGLASGGQTLVSRSAWELSRAQVAGEVRSRDLGEVRLKGIDTPEPVTQVWLEGLREDFPGLAGKRAVLNPPRHNLPLLGKRFVGRVSERLDLAGRLTAQGQRLVTLRGPGGIGKTTLAKVVGQDALDDFPGGVWFVECEVAATRSDIFSAIVSALSLDPHGQSSEEAVESALASARRLLILDCFEGVVEHSGLVDELMAWAPDTRILVTSRILLGLRHEHEVELRPLSNEKNADGLSDGVTLFQDAARQARPEFTVTRANRGLVERVVQCVDSVPLGLILAAGRLRYLSLEELAAEIEESALSVTKGAVTAFGRHADWSLVLRSTMDRLETDDRKMAAKFAWFQSGFTLADARGVFPDHPDIFGLIVRLRDNSVLTGTVRSGSMRYRELDTVREYFRDALAPEEASELTRSMVRYFSAKALAVGKAFESGDWAVASRSMVEDLASYRAVTTWAEALGDHDSVVRLTESLARAFVESGLTDEFNKLADASLVSAGVLGLDSLQVLILGLKGAVARRSGKVEDAIRNWQARADACGASGDLDSQADSLVDVANVAYDSGMLDRAEAALAAFSVVAPQVTNALVLLSGRVLHAKFLARSGQQQAALDLLEGVEETLRRTDPDQLSLFVYQGYCETLLACGLAKKSEAIAREWLSLSLSGGMVHWSMVALACLGDSHEALGDVESARMAWNAVLAARSRVARARFTSFQTRLSAFVSRNPPPPEVDPGRAVVEMGWEELAHLCLQTR